MKKRISIVTPDYLASTPRVVKEAEALSAAGFEVRVVSSQGPIETLRKIDAQLREGRLWKLSTVRWSAHQPGEKTLYVWSRLRYHAAQNIPAFCMGFGHWAERGQTRIYSELASLAAAQPADLYIGHYPGGLAAAAWAATQHKAALGYDLEDLYTGQDLLGAPESRETRRIRLLEDRYLPRCSHITASSSFIAKNVTERRYGISPQVIYNVFPLSGRAHIDGQMLDRHGPALSLYWFSQVIGEGRGIEDAIRAAGLLDAPVQIHLRGECSAFIRRKFMDLAASCHMERQLFIHPPVPPNQMLSRAVEHDAGLALEIPATLNRQLAVTNKFFFYLLAGLAVIASDMPGQRNILEATPEAGFLYPSGDFHALAGQLKVWIKSPEKLRCSQRAALKAAEGKWNWERESQKLVQAVEGVFSIPRTTEKRSAA